MKNKLLYCLLCWVAGSFFGTTTYAQQQNPDTTTNDIISPLRLPPALVVKYSWLSLFEFPNYIQAGVEYRLAPQVYLQHEVGFPYIINWSNDYSEVNDSLHRNLRGIRFRTALLKYEPAYQETHRDVFYYWGPEIFVRHEIWNSPRWVQRYGGVYNQLLDVRYEKWVYGFNLLVGQKSRFSIFTIDVLVGGGVAIRKKTTNIPADANILERGFWSFVSDEGRVFPNVVFGFKMGICLK